MFEAAIIIFVAITCLAAGFLMGYRSWASRHYVTGLPFPEEEEEEELVTEDGECPHQSNKRLEVTQMGDDGRYYLCELCGKKVKESELRRKVK